MNKQFVFTVLAAVALQATETASGATALVDDHEIGINAKSDLSQLRQRLIHGAVRSLENVDAVNDLHLPECNRKADFRVRGQHGIIVLALGFGELLGVIEPAEATIQARFRPAARKHHRGGDHRAGERAAACFIHTGNGLQPPMPEPAFEGEPIPKLGAQCISTSQVPMPLR